MAKVSLFKSTADGEQLNYEFDLEAAPGDDLREKLDPYFQLVDDRLLEMNLRILVSNVMVAKLEPQLQVAFHSVMEVLHGQRPMVRDFDDLLQKAIGEVVESLAKRGYNPTKLHKVIDNTYRPGKTGAVSTVLTEKEPA